MGMIGSDEGGRDSSSPLVVIPVPLLTQVPHKALDVGGAVLLYLHPGQAHETIDLVVPLGIKLWCPSNIPSVTHG